MARSKLQGSRVSPVERSAKEDRYAETVEFSDACDIEKSNPKSRVTTADEKVERVGRQGRTSRLSQKHDVINDTIVDPLAAATSRRH